jgi:Spy/CpxP family protein refolding chaperone
MHESIRSLVHACLGAQGHKREVVIALGKRDDFDKYASEAYKEREEDR